MHIDQRREPGPPSYSGKPERCGRKGNSGHMLRHADDLPEHPRRVRLGRSGRPARQEAGHLHRDRRGLPERSRSLQARRVQPSDHRQLRRRAQQDRGRLPLGLCRTAARVLARGDRMPGGKRQVREPRRRRRGPDARRPKSPTAWPGRRTRRAARVAVSEAAGRPPDHADRLRRDRRRVPEHRGGRRVGGLLPWDYQRCPIRPKQDRRRIPWAYAEQREPSWKTPVTCLDTQMRFPA